ncbi:Lrp/AsnC family transcriptional regulator [Aurantimonas sp. VKM B-3413]|uniref:Lrp/AsnC family transcriptional regulator n=1 Tax=Aurantimonas sp. VKM B-3413 TaxID=2779401 RepID=UPI001E5ADFCC|nr:Lrp/AsnC family transcriptional regulator [Aurantimonas sp. VKM B-3413]MCB8836416.1 Lrp/AsnC family transcriptional regulator [Aurantimonas sp. VKM B-3413]
MKLDALDLKILAAIQREGRITKLALAEKVGLSPTPCWVRLKKLETAGIVTGYTARLDLRLVAKVTTVMVEVTLGHHRQGDFERFERAVRDSPAVVACWAVGGGVDYILKVAAPDVDAYQRLMDGWLEREIGIARYFTYIVTRTVKEAVDPPVEALAPTV